MRAPHAIQSAASRCSRTAARGPTRSATLEVRAAAAGLQRLGVKKGDRVIAWLPTGRAMVLTWFATNYLGAVFVPLNTAYRGDVLAHVVNAAGATVMVAYHTLLERLAGLTLPHLRQVVVVGGDAATAAAPLELLPESTLHGDAATLDESADIQHWDIQSIIYTSGTTGYSKGVLSPYLQLYSTAMTVYGYMGDGEAILVNLPMFHVGGTSPTCAALVRGGSIHLVDGFSTDKFWDQVRTGNCVTTSGLIGVMAAFLAKSAPRPDDRDNPLKCLTMFPVSEETVAFANRFGFEYLTGFNMTEVSAPLVTDLNTHVYGSCGRPRSGVEARLVDEHDIEVARGDIGELIVRSDLPWTMNAGYNGQPEATAAAWRNGWFHTGDLFRQDDGRQFLLRRPQEGHDPPPRRKHLVVRGREQRAPVPRRRRSRGCRRRKRDRRTGSDGRGDGEAGTDGGSAGTHRVPDPEAAVFHGAALCARRRPHPEDRDQQDPQGLLPRPGHHARHLGPGARRHQAAPRQAVGKLCPGPQ